MTAWIDGPGSLLRRPDAISSDFLFAASVGPDYLADPSKGLLKRVWMVNTHETGKVMLSRSSIDVEETIRGVKGQWETPEEIFTYTGAPIVEVDLGFDQNGNVVVCAERNGAVWLYWFDPREGKYVFQSICPGRTPRLLLDDPETTTESDLLLFYATPGGASIEMRQQRELYDEVHPTPATGSNLRCEEVAKASDYRLHVYYSRHNLETGRYELVRMESAPYPVRQTDATAIQQYVEDVELTEVLISLEWVESAAIMQRLVNVQARDLTLKIMPEEGEFDGFIDMEAAVIQQTVQQTILQDLVITLVQAPDEARIVQRVAACNVLDYVIVMPDFADESNVVISQRLQSVQLL